LKKLTAQRLPVDAQREEHFEADKLNDLVGK
jgi:hypothetical protein